MWVDKTKLMTRCGKVFEIGFFDTPSLGDLRHRARSICRPRKTEGSKMLKVDFVHGDVSNLHADPKYR